VDGRCGSPRRQPERDLWIGRPVAAAARSSPPVFGAARFNPLKMLPQICAGEKLYEYRFAVEAPHAWQAVGVRRKEGLVLSRDQAWRTSHSSCGCRTEAKEVRQYAAASLGKQSARQDLRQFGRMNGFFADDVSMRRTRSDRDLLEERLPSGDDRHGRSGQVPSRGAGFQGRFRSRPIRAGGIH